MITSKNTIAVAVDYQSHILPAMYERKELITSSVKLLKGLKILDVPIYITQQYTKGLGMTVDEITEAAGSKDYTEKLSFSAFRDLAPIIPSSNETPYVIICGIEAHVCVLQTVLELKEAGYVPVLVADCVSSRNALDREIAWMRARDAGAIITTCEAVLFELLSVAGGESFKLISRLIK